MINPTRRTLLKSVATASVGALLPNPWMGFLTAQITNKNKSQGMLERDIESSHVEVSGNNIFYRRYGKGPAILMVHGFPRTSLMWRYYFDSVNDRPIRFIRVYFDR
jgi:hypothetical protein